MTHQPNEPDMTEQDKVQAKSLGQKLGDAMAGYASMPTDWDTVPDDVKTMLEKTALAFAASLSHDETASAVNAALTAKLAECEGREKGLRKALEAFMSAMKNNGNFEDGCFYYSRFSAPELERPMKLATAALSDKAGA